MSSPLARIAVVVTALLALAGCGSSPSSTTNEGAGSSSKTLTISAIPDQDPQVLQRLYGAVSEYLASALGVKVNYVPVTDYTASVTAFRRGDLNLVFFGGLTGVQARLQVPGAKPIAQRDIDEKFRSVFVANASTGLQPFDSLASLRSLAGHTFTLGSQTSTSGSLMPQYFLSEAGMKLTDFRNEVGYSGSHDSTIKLVEAGTYEVGALNGAVWDQRLKEGKVNTDKVREIFRTPTYHDYHWLARPDLDEQFGAGFTDRVKDALFALDGSDDRERQILELFHAGAFIETNEQNYEQIEAIGRAVGLIK